MLKSIKGFNHYYVSDEGCVLSTKRGDGVFRERKLRQDAYGYQQLLLCRAGQRPSCRKVHRLVAQAFIPNPESKPQVNHKNGDRSDNRVANLEWVTCQENHRHAFDVLGRKGSNTGKFGGNSPSAKPVNQLDLGGTLVMWWPSARDAERDGGFSHVCICRCCNGAGATHKGFKWEFAPASKSK